MSCDKKIPATKSKYIEIMILPILAFSNCVLCRIVIELLTDKYYFGDTLL